MQTIIVFILVAVYGKLNLSEYVVVNVNDFWNRSLLVSLTCAPEVASSSVGSAAALSADSLPAAKKVRKLRTSAGVSVDSLEPSV